ncbi:MAG: methyltransferase domain-containing protein [Candidatus Altiarchaeota archaeon]
MRYKWDARGYDKNASFQRGLATELIDKLGLKGDERVLDVGCGDGKNTSEIAARLPRGTALGIDSSEDMIGHAKREYPPARFPNLSFEVMDVLKMGYRGEFDVVFSNATLHWIKDHRRMLKKVAASLRPGGRILIQMGGKGNAADTFRVMDAFAESEKWRDYFTGYESPFGFWSPKEYEPWMKEAGLAPRRIELIERDMTQVWPEGFKGWIRSTWLPYTESVPEGLREEFIDEVAKEYVRLHPLRKDGKVHVAMVRLEVEAEKENVPVSRFGIHPQMRPFERSRGWQTGH